MTEDRIIRFQGAEWEPLVNAEDYALANEIIQLGAYNSQRAYAAALAATWNGPKRPRSKLSTCGFSTGLFGGAVINELIKRGATMPEIIEAGGMAYVALIDVLVKQREMQEAEGFSEAGEADSTSG